MSTALNNNSTRSTVEDHDDARTSLGLFLKHLGANVMLARNAFEGIEAVKNSRPNFVLSDISMPDRDGFDLLRDIQALGPHAGRIPVVAMTTVAARADRSRIFEAACQR